MRLPRDLLWALGVVPKIAHNSYNPNNFFLTIRTLQVQGMGKGCVEASREAAVQSGRFFEDVKGVQKALELISKF